ncbi:MAG: peptide chain release factor N(5)-glutamine methyltransferase [Pseudomonadales bacterium]
MIGTVADALTWAFDELSRAFGKLRPGRFDELSRAFGKLRPGHFHQLSGESGHADVEWLLMGVLGATRAQLKAHAARRLSSEEQRAFESHLRRYASGEPLAYITGHQPFWKLDLAVDPRVLIPRPETELLVETVIELGQSLDAHVLDLGTGCGAIALSLALERPDWRLLASDVSADALAVAVQNSRELAAAHTMAQVEFRCSDWFSDIEERFDFIVANPPYVALDDPLYEGSGFEPNEALFAGYSGLEALRMIIGEAPRRLRGGGYLLVEHGNLQAASVRELMCDAGLDRLESRRDLAGHDRITLGQRQRGLT